MTDLPENMVLFKDRDGNFIAMESLEDAERALLAGRIKVSDPSEIPVAHGRLEFKNGKAVYHFTQDGGTEHFWLDWETKTISTK